MRLAIIVNPISGRTGRRFAAGTERAAQAQQFARGRAGIDAEIVTTTDAGHGAEMARRFVARGFDAVIAWGGDGTVNEVAGPLIGTGTALGIIPAGSGDGLVGSLGLPREPGLAFAAATSGRVNTMDVGYFGARHFLNTAGVGFDAAVAADFNKSARRGLAGYLTRVGRMVWRYQPAHYSLRLDDALRAGVHMMIAFANGREYGNRLQLAPLADLRDGWLEAVLVADGPPWQQLWRARRLMFPSNRPAHGITRVRVKTAAITGEHLQCHVDGESFAASGTVEVRLAPLALRVLGF